MIILALDIATKTGWAVGSITPDKTIEWVESGVENFRQTQNESKGTVFLRFRRWLFDRAQEWEPGLIHYEQPHMRGKAATTLLMGFITRLIEICDLWDPPIPYSTVQTNVLKKAATGKGNAGKPAMIEAAKAAFPDIEIIDDNHADALHLLRHAIDNYA